MTDLAWVDATLRAARPKVIAALARRLRDLDRAEEAFQEACLRALKHWPAHGPPRDAAAWLIMVGRNAALDELRRRSRDAPLPEDDALSDLADAEAEIVEQVDGSDYRDDILRLLFVCCHPDLPAAQQIALALRVVCGLSVREIARAFLITEAAAEQRITRAKRRIAQGDIEYGIPGARDRAERAGLVAAMIYLLFNEGYAASGGAAHLRLPLCVEAIRLARLLLKLFPGEPEFMGLLSLLLLQHARAPARLDADGAIVLLDHQDRRMWYRGMIDEGLALLAKATRHRRPGPYQIQAGLAAVHARAASPEDTDWTEMDQLYALLETVQPSPVVTLNRAVAVSRRVGPQAALDMIEPLAGPLQAYFHYFGLRGALLQQLDRADEARVAFNRAIALARTQAEAAHIRAHLDVLARDAESEPKILMSPSGSNAPDRLHAASARDRAPGMED